MLLVHGLSLGETMSEDKAGAPITPQAWQQLVLPVVVAAMIGAGGTALLMWREAPLTAASAAQTAADVTQLKNDVAALQRAQLVIEADLRQGKEQMANVRETLLEIKQYNGQTMKGMNELNVKFAEISVKLDSQKESKKK